MFWNQREIVPPPTVTFKLKPEHNEKALQFQSIIKEAIAVLMDDSSLTAERFVLQKMLYKSKNQHRHEKSLHRMKQIDNCYKRLKQMAMINIMNNFKECCYCGSSANEWYFPSRQMLQYLLVRLIGMTNLLHKACAYAELAYTHCMQTIAHGFFVPNNILFTSMLSRLWVLFKALAMHAEKWYEKLYQLMECLGESPVQWLPSDFSLTASISKPESTSNMSKYPKRLYKLGMLDENMRDIESILQNVAKKNDDDSECDDANQSMLNDSVTDDYSMGFKDEEMGILIPVDDDQSTSPCNVMDQSTSPSKVMGKKAKKKKLKKKASDIVNNNQAQDSTISDTETSKNILQKFVKSKTAFTEIRGLCSDASCDILQIDGSTVATFDDKLKKSLRKLPFLFSDIEEFERKRKSLESNKKAKKVLFTILWNHVKSKTGVTKPCDGFDSNLKHKK